MRSYRQDCGVAHALDLLGDRWTLMILRNLCSGPWRFTDLLASLSGIGRNLLSARLTELAERGLVSQSDRGYHLAPAGQMLRPLLRELMALGKVFGGQEQGAPVPARVAMGVVFDPLAAAGQSLAVSVQVDEEQFALLVSSGVLTVVDGPCPVPADVTLEASRAAFEAAGQGVSRDDFRLRGSAAALHQFRALFSLPVSELEQIRERYGDKR